ncbi:MAG: DUF3991 and toprim domain-containing protein [Oscillospiraceae bacterium]|jgi:hypothetical protein|nr:DUF3991 and toprim domain-containing protein [Oscillospiraceae bacterium]
MPYITPDIIQLAREVDLLTYLETYEPDNLVSLGNGNYCTKEHDSLKISNGKWCWWSRRVGGANALDYLTVVRQLPFTEAVEALIGGKLPMTIPTPSQQPKPAAKEDFRLPCASFTTAEITRYLTSRGVSESVIRYCIEQKILYESYPQHSCVFVGKDETGQPRFACWRGTEERRMMGDVKHSDKRFSFRISPSDSTNSSATLHLFEGAIDALSYATIAEQRGLDFTKMHLLSLSGIHAPKQSTEQSEAHNAAQTRAPSALENYLESHPEITKISVHFDNDYPGQSAAQGLVAALSDRYLVENRPPKSGKDVNEYLQESNREKGKFDLGNCL